MKPMSQEAAKALEVINAEQVDWTAKCRKCGKEIKGTLKQVSEHICGQ